jgi:hypothetical protein
MGMANLVYTGVTHATDAAQGSQARHCCCETLESASFSAGYPMRGSVPDPSSTIPSCNSILHT